MICLVGYSVNASAEGLEDTEGPNYVRAAVGFFLVAKSTRSEHNGELKPKLVTLIKRGRQLLGSSAMRMPCLGFAFRTSP